MSSFSSASSSLAVASFAVSVAESLAASSGSASVFAASLSAAVSPDFCGAGAAVGSAVSSLEARSWFRTLPVEPDPLWWLRHFRWILKHHWVDLQRWQAVRILLWIPQLLVRSGLRRLVPVYLVLTRRVHQLWVPLPVLIPLVCRRAGRFRFVGFGWFRFGSITRLRVEFYLAFCFRFLFGGHFRFQFSTVLGTVSSSERGTGTHQLWW